MSYIGYYEDCCAGGDNPDNAASNQYEIIEKISDFTAEKYKFYSVDTTNESITVILPTPTQNGEWFGIIDKHGTFAVNNLIINYNSIPIRNNAGNLIVDVNNVVFKLVYNNGNWNIFDMSIAIVINDDDDSGPVGISSGYDIISISHNLNAERFKYYMINNLIPISILLPASPSNGDWVIISDINGRFSTNNITISASYPILGNADGILLDFNRAKLKFVYYNNNWDVLNLG